MLQKWFEETQTHLWGQKSKGQDLEGFGNSREELPYQLWNVGKYGNCADAAITGIMPPPLLEPQVESLVLLSYHVPWHLFAFRFMESNQLEY